MKSQQKNEYGIRRVTDEDRMRLFEWVNDSEVRKNSFSEALISVKEHNEWFEKALKDPDVIIYVLMRDGTPIGQCRFNICDGEKAEIDYSVKKDCRGNGIGEILIKKAMAEFQTEHPHVTQIIGNVKPHNIPSVKTFKKCGFEESYYSFTYTKGEKK